MGTERTAGLILPEGSREGVTQEEAAMGPGRAGRGEGSDSEGSGGRALQAEDTAWARAPRRDTAKGPGRARSRGTCSLVSRKGVAEEAGKAG